MSEDVGLTAASISEFDQAYASSAEFFDSVLEAHRINIGRVKKDDVPEEVAISALTRFLLTECSFESVVSGLTVAIVRIDRALREAER